MDENEYLQEILNGIGLAINEKNDSEIIMNFPIKFVKKNMQFIISNDYQITIQPLGTFLVDFINSDFNNHDDFLKFFMKYSLSILTYNKIKNIFSNGYCSQEDFYKFANTLFNKNKDELLKFQKQVDIILDYCLLSPNSKSLKFTPVQRLYVLRRIFPNLAILTNNKSTYYSINLFSSFPGNTESEIYNFLSMKKNVVTEFNLIIPYDIASILYRSILSVLTGDTYLKTCKNCNKYFIAKNKSSDYCNNIVLGTKKTCQEIGRLKVFNRNKNNDATISLYYKIYNRKAMMKSRNPDIDQYVKNFDNFKNVGKKKLQKYKDGTLSSEDFKNWIKKNS